MSKQGTSFIVVFGAGLSLISSVSYAILYLVAYYLKEVDSQYVLLIRVLLTSIPIIIFALFMVGWQRIRRYLFRIRIKPIMLFFVIVNSAVVCYQTWLFSWAPANGYGLDVSMGYLILPLAIIFAGKVVLKEKISGFKVVAIFVAALGVIINLIMTQHFSGYTAFIATSYAIMFVIRRIYKMDGLSAVAVESFTLLCITITFYFTYSAIYPEHSSFSFLSADYLTQLALIIAGVLSFIAWLSYIFAGKFLPFNLWGLLSFIEVILLVCISLFIGEKINSKEIPMYILLSLSMIILLLENIVGIFKPKPQAN